MPTYLWDTTLAGFDHLTANRFRGGLLKFISRGNCLLTLVSSRCDIEDGNATASATQIGFELHVYDNFG